MAAMLATMILFHFFGGFPFLFSFALFALFSLFFWALRQGFLNLFYGISFTFARTLSLPAVLNVFESPSTTMPLFMCMWLLFCCHFQIFEKGTLFASHLSLSLSLSLFLSPFSMEKRWLVTHNFKIIAKSCEWVRVKATATAEVENVPRINVWNNELHIK